MLKKYMVLYAPDANDGGNPSAPLDDKNGADPSPAEPTQDPEPEPTDPEPEPEPELEPSADPEPEPEPLPPEDVVENPIVDKPEDKELPFHNHKRFQDLIVEKNSVKQEFESVKPLVEQAKATNELMRQYNITPQEHQADLQFRVALRQDPAAAFRMMKPLYDQLAQFVGEVLPADLQSEVASATLSPERAREIASARAQQQYQSWRQQSTQQGQQQQNGELVSTSISSWIGMKQTIDADLKQGTPLWELTDKNIRSAPPFRTAQEALQGCEKAYNDAKTFLNQFKKSQAVKPPLRSRQQLNQTSVVVKSSDDVVRSIINNKGRLPSLRYS